MFYYATDFTCAKKMKRGIEYLWWQDREIFTLSYWRRGLLWRHYLVHHPVSGAQTGYVKWWYGDRGIEDHDIEEQWEAV